MKNLKKQQLDISKGIIGIGCMLTLIPILIIIIFIVYHILVS